MPNTRDVKEPQDPRERFAKPPFPEQQQPAPGSSEALNPPADYGENTYNGNARLQGRAALITGRTAASAVRLRCVSPRKAPTSFSRICPKSSRTPNGL